MHVPSAARLVTVAILTLGAAPALPSTPGGDVALKAVAAIREGVSSEGLSGVVAAAARLGGIDSMSDDAPLARVSAAVPRALARPVARLLGAVERAKHLARSSLRADLRTLERLQTETLWTMTRAITGVKRFSPERMEALEARAEAAVDRGTLYAGAAVLARAIDEAVPMLMVASPPALARPGVVGCDLVDLTPALCIGGFGDNVYQDDEVLLIDLGGNDAYHNTAGGADVLGTLSNVSVNIDLGGDDRYETVTPTPSNSLVAQGAGNIGSIGILLDTEGDDIYRLDVGVPQPGHGFAITQGQGYGGAGVGILADLVGNDSYTLANEGLGESCAFIGCFGASTYGQGLGVLPAIGMLWDRGTGNDRYRFDSMPSGYESSEGVLVPGGGDAVGGGVGGVAVGIFADGGGADQMRMHARTLPVPPEEERPISAPITLAGGWGSGFLGGVGVALAGIGPTEWSVVAESEAPQVYSVGASGFGTASFVGVGAFSDAGGDDSYEVSATSIAKRDAAIDDACGCPGVEAVAAALGANASGFGSGSTGAVALMQDGGGSDTYSASASAVADARARDGRTVLIPAPEPAEGEDPATEGALALAATTPARVLAQGVGVLGASGQLIDTGGDDSYEATTRSQATAEAHAVLDEAPTSGQAIAGAASSEAQGVGFTGGSGSLHDTGGRDRYALVSTTDADATPASELARGEEIVLGQGAASSNGSGTLSDVEGAQGDVFASSPPNPACTGTRGDPTWRDCGSAAGLGVNT